MNPFALPWLELSLAVPLVGVACVWLVRDTLPKSRWCLGFTGATLGCTLMACAGYYNGWTPTAEPWWLRDWAGRQFLAVDELSAPLLPLVALLHLLTALATARTKMGRFSFSRLLVGEAVQLTVFACLAPWPLIGLLALDAALPFFEIRRRGRSARLYAIHAGLFVGLLGAGWACVDGMGLAEVGSALLLGAVLARTGVVPAHVWITDLFEKGSFGTSLLFVTPLIGVYAAVRLVFPISSGGRSKRSASWPWERRCTRPGWGWWSGTPAVSSPTCSSVMRRWCWSGLGFTLRSP